MGPNFATWSDPQYVFTTLEETPFGQDHSLFGRPILNYQGQPSMQDNLRLQRLIQHLSTLVDGFLEQHAEGAAQEAETARPEEAQTQHEEIMHIAEAVFKEMSLQSYRADRATAVSKLWSCLSIYLNHCATQATSNAASTDSSTQPEEQSAADIDEPDTAAADNADTDAAAADDAVTSASEESAEAADADNEAAAPDDTCANDAAADEEATGACAEADAAPSNADTTGTVDAAAEEDAAEPEQAADAAAMGAETTQKGLSRTVSNNSRIAALEQQNADMKAQIASLNARLTQHAQHAEQLLVGTEAFFGPKAGTVIGQQLEAESSGSDVSFSSARERSISRPLSAGSSFSSALSNPACSRSASPGLRSRGLSRGASRAQGLGLGEPVQSGVSDASFATAVEGALSRMGSATSSTHGQLHQSAAVASAPAEDSEEDTTSQIAAGHGRGKRKALKAFLHKLRHPAVAADAGSAPVQSAAQSAASRGNRRSIPAETAPVRQGSPTGTAPVQPTLGTAADRAAAHIFARSLSSKAALPASPNRLTLPSMPQTPFAQAGSSGAPPDTPQQVVPPSMRVRTLSRKFSEGTQQSQVNRRLTQLPTSASAAAALPSVTKGKPDQATSPASPASPAPSKTAPAKSPQQAGPRDADVALLKAPEAALDRHAALNRSLSSATSAFAFGASRASGPKLTRSVTDKASAFAFSGTAAGTSKGSSRGAHLPFGMGKAAASVSSAAEQLFGFSVGDTVRSVPALGSGGLGSAFSLGPNSSLGLFSFQPTHDASAFAKSAEADAAAGADIDESSAEADAAADAEVGESTAEDDAAAKAAAGLALDEAVAASANVNAGLAQEGDSHSTHDADGDDSHFALPNSLLSDDEDDDASESAAGSVVGSSGGNVHKDEEEDEQEEEDDEEEAGGAAAADAVSEAEGSAEGASNQDAASESEETGQEADDDDEPEEEEDEEAVSGQDAESGDEQEASSVNAGSEAGEEASDGDADTHQAESQGEHDEEDSHSGSEYEDGTEGDDEDAGHSHDDKESDAGSHEAASHSDDNLAEIDQSSINGAHDHSEDEESVD